MSPPALDLRGAFLAAIDALAKSRISHAFIGALPVLAWGRVRATTDIDLVVIADEAWERLTAELRSRGFQSGRSVGPAEPGDTLPDIAVFRTSDPLAVRLDVFIAKTSFERTVIETARIADVLGVPVRLARPEASIIYKLLAKRGKDLDDVESIFVSRHMAGDSLDWDFLDHWAEQWGIAEQLQLYRDRFRN